MEPAATSPECAHPGAPDQRSSRRRIPRARRSTASSLVARIMRGRELAAAAAGLPPLDSDQVLDLQQTAGNRLTTGALARWTDGMPACSTPRRGAALARFATPEQALAAPAAELLDHLLPARAGDPAAHAAICAALDARAPAVAVRVTLHGRAGADRV